MHVNKVMLQWETVPQFTWFGIHGVWSMSLGKRVQRAFSYVILCSGDTILVQFLY